MREQTTQDKIDYHHQRQCDECDADKLYDQVELALNSPNLDKKLKPLYQCDVLRLAIKELMRLRFKDPVSFDFICLKIIEPELKYEEIAEALCSHVVDYQVTPTRMVGKHRARVSELAKKAYQRFPEIKDLLGVRNVT